jgi:DNA-binding cell septation regulator SpoVG
MVPNQNGTFLCFHTSRIEQANPRTSRFREKGGGRDIAFPANAETRNMIEQAVLAEYEKIVAAINPWQCENQSIKGEIL